MLAGLCRLFFIGYLLLVVALTATWFAVSGLVAALVSWPGLFGVAALAALLAWSATRKATRSRRPVAGPAVRQRVSPLIVPGRRRVVRVCKGLPVVRPVADSESFGKGIV